MRNVVRGVLLGLAGYAIYRLLRSKSQSIPTVAHAE